MEVEYFISLLELGVLPAIEEDTEQAKAKLREIYTSFTEADAQKIKDIEKVPHHHLFAPSVCTVCCDKAKPCDVAGSGWLPPFYLCAQTTNHDVKAVEYFIKAKFTEFGWEKQKEWIHFALTSQDINNTAIPLSIKDGVEQVYLPALKYVLRAVLPVISFSFSFLFLPPLFAFVVVWSDESSSS